MKVWLGKVARAFRLDWASEKAQDTFEYVLVLGVVVVAALLAIGTPIGGAVVDGVVGDVCRMVKGIDDIDGDPPGVGTIDFECPGD